MKLGMGQLLVEGGEPDRNLERAGAMVREAAQQGCDAVVLPECLDLGWTHPSAKSEAQSIPGAHSDFFCDLARENRIYVCAGLTEKAEDKVYNSAVLIDSQGDIVLKYNKINVLDVGHEFYAIGRTLSVAETPFGLIGVNICADNYIDSLEIGHTLARMGAQVILSPSSWTVDYSVTDSGNPYADKWLRPLRTLAELYDLVVVSVTSVGYIVGGPYEGKKMVGCSLAVGKDGLIAQSTYNEVAGELVTVSFDVPTRPEKGTDIGRMLRDRGYSPGYRDAE